MPTKTYLLILLSGIVALLVAGFLYQYKSKNTLRRNVFFAFLRFLSVFLLLLLLVNPQVERMTTFTEKPNLVVLADNSNSIAHFKQENTLTNGVEAIVSNKALKERFNIDVYSFNKNLNRDSLTFKTQSSNLGKAFSGLKSIYKNTITPIVVLTDGNQTIGSDYIYKGKEVKQPIYPVVVGDTTQFADIKISRLNVNRYAYLKNKFPVEAFITYKGEKSVNKRATIYKGNKAVFSKIVRLSKNNNSAVITTNLLANSIGVNKYSLKIDNLTNEKNIKNNRMFFNIEVIDESTKVAIVSKGIYPDLGAIKKSLESNKQRKVDILSPIAFTKQFNKYQLAILYQPDASFGGVFSLVNSNKINSLTIIGTTTNIDVINTNFDYLKFDKGNQNEEYQAEINPNYNSFIVQDIDFSSYPPLKGIFNAPNFTKGTYSTILTKVVNGISVEEPLIATIEDDGARHGVILGEGLWRWRAQSYLNNESFQSFDNFIGKLTQYLASKDKKSRLTVDYQSFYSGNEALDINVQVFNKNYEFNNSDRVTISLINTQTKKKEERPFVLQNNYYKVDLSDLPKGTYSFKVKAETSNLVKAGEFQILDFNIEAQALNADVNKLNTLALNSDGKLFVSNQITELIKALKNDKRYVSIQKSKTEIQPLIEWKLILFLIVLIITIEWFLRKYKGLI